MAAEVIRALSGGAAFVLTARILGTSNYGVSAAITAVAMLVHPILTLGMTWTLPASAAKYPLAPRQLRGTVTAVTVFSLVPAAIGLGLASSLWIAEASPATVILLLLVELVVFGNSGLIAQGELGRGRPRAYCLWAAAAATLRLVIAVIAVAVHADSLNSWARISGELCVPVVALTVLLTGIASWRPNAGLVRRDFRMGFGFMGTALSTNVFDNADKYIVLQVAGAHAAGIYSAAYRIAAYALVPVRGVAARAYPRYFSLATKNQPGQMVALAKNSSQLGVALALGSGAFLVPASYFGVQILLSGFSEALPLLIPLIGGFALRSLHYAFGDCLYALGATRKRIASIWLVTVVYIPCLVIASKGYGAWGAAMMMVISEGVLVFFLFVAFFRAVGAARDIRSDSSFTQLTSQ